MVAQPWSRLGLFVLIGLTATVLFSGKASAADSTPLAGANASMDAVCSFNSVSWTTTKTGANDAAANDVTLGSVGGLWFDYFGMTEPFTKVVFNLGTAGAGTATYTWSYSTGNNVWTDFGSDAHSTAVTDGTAGFHNGGVTSLSFAIPDNWAKQTADLNNPNCLGHIYFIRAAQSGAFTTTPKANQVSAVEYNYRFSVRDELGTQMAGIPSGEVALANGDDTTLYAFRERTDLGTGIYEIAGDMFDADHRFDLRVSHDGYVRGSVDTGSLSTTLTDASASASPALPFGVKITGVTDELGGSLAGQGLALKAAASDNTLTNACTEAAGAWYCAVPINKAETRVKATLDGYAERTGGGVAAARTAHSDAQATGTLGNVRFAYRVASVSTELAGALSTVTVDTGNSFTRPCTESAGSWYCKVPVADTGLSIRSAKDGYEQKNDSAFPSDRTSQTDAQVNGTVSGQRYAFRVGSVQDETGNTLASVTVETGNAFAIACVESSSSFYCPVPTAHTGITIRATKTGYVQTSAATFSRDRDSNDDKPMWGNVTGVQFAYKLTGVATEGPAASLTTVTVTAGNAFGTSCSEVSGAWYCPVPVADTALVVKVAKDGYVTNTGTSFATDRTSHSDAQVTGSVGSVAFSYKVTGVQQELAGALTTVTVKAGNAQGTTCTESGGAWYCPVPLADTTLTIQAAKDGYVTDTGSSFASDRTAATDAQRTATVTNVRFAFKVTGITTEGPAAALSAVTVTTGNAFGTSCAESSGAWYCAVPLADTGVAIRVVKDGYVTTSGTSFAADRTAATDVQRTKAVASVQFAYKVTGVTTEGPAASLTTVTITAGNAFGTSCTESGGAWYCAVPAGDTALILKVAKDGYVTDSATSFASDRTSGSDAQVSASVAGVQFAYKVTGVTQEIGTALTTVSISAGNLQATSCAESAGAWYCPVPVADTTLTIRAAKAGYVTDTSSSFASDRTAGTDAQRTGTVTNVRFGFKVTAITSEQGASLAGVAVAVGDAFGTSCTESSQTWYCPVPVGDTNTIIRAAKAGYVTNTATTFPSDRTADTDAPVSQTVGSVRYTAKVVAPTETNLVGVQWERLLGGIWSVVSPDATSGNAAFFTQDPADGAVQFRATKYAVTSTTPPFTGSAAAQQSFTLTLASTLDNAATTPSSLVAGSASTYDFAFDLHHAWPADGRWTVAFPASYTLGSPTIDLAGADGSASASVSGSTVTVTRSGGTATGNSTRVHVTVHIAANPHQSGSFGAFAIETQTAAALSLDSGSAPAVTITAAPLTALSSSALNDGAGNTTTATFGFTTANAWPADGRISLVLPPGYSVPGALAFTLNGVDGTIIGGSSGSNGRYVNATRQGDGTTATASSAIQLSINGIRNPTTSGGTGTFGVTTRTTGSVAIDTGTAPSVTIQPGPVATIALAPTTPTVTVATDLDFTPTARDAWNNLKTILPTWSVVPASCGNITSPAGVFTAPTNAPRTCTIVAHDGGIDGTTTADIVAGTIDHLHVSPSTRNVIVDATYDFDVVGHDVFHNTVTNTATWAATCGSVDAAGLFHAPNMTTTCTVTATQAAMTDSALVTVIPEPIQHIHIAPLSTSLDVGQSTTFAPTGHDRFHNPVPVAASWGADCGIIDGNGTYTATAAGDCTVTAKDGNATGTAVVHVTATVLSSASLKPVVEPSKAGAYVFTIVPSYTWPADGRIQVHFPAGFVLDAVTGSLKGTGGKVSASAAGQLATIQRDGTGGAVGQGTPLTLTLKVVNPATRGFTTAFTLATQDGAGRDINLGTVDGVNIGPIAKAKVASKQLVAGQTASYKISFTTPVDWPNDGRLVVELPLRYTTASPTATLVANKGAAGTVTATATGTTLTLTRAADGPIVSAGAPIEFTLQGIVNPTVAAATGTFQLVLQDGSQGHLATGFAAGVTTLPGPLSQLASAADSVMALRETAYHLTFTLYNDLPSDGQLEVLPPEKTYQQNAYEFHASQVTVDGLDGTFHLGTSGRSLTLVRDSGTTIVKGTALTMHVTAVYNPIKATGSLSILTHAATGLVIDSGKLPAVKVVADPLAPGGVTSTSHTAGKWTTSRTVIVTWKAPKDKTVDAYSWGLDVVPDLVPDGAAGVLTATYTGVTDGLHTFQVRAHNAADSWSPPIKFDYIVVDGTAPVVGVGTSPTHPGPGCNASPLVTVTWTPATDPLSGLLAKTYTVALDGVGPKSTAGLTMTLKALPGPHTVFISADDTVRNRDTISVPVTVCGLAPALQKAKIWSPVASITGEWFQTDYSTDLGYSWALDADPDLTQDSVVPTFDFVGVGDGLHTLKMRVHYVDDTWSDPISYGNIQIDTEAPSTPVLTSTTHPTSGCNAATMATFSWTKSIDTLSKVAKNVAYELDGASLGSTSKTTVTLAGLDSGAHTFTVRPVDGAGNEAPADYDFTVC